jgi:hypothetical protein
MDRGLSLWRHHAVCVCACMRAYECTFQNFNELNTFHEILSTFTIEGHPNIAIFNSLQLIITPWPARELVNCKRHQYHLI